MSNITKSVLITIALLSVPVLLFLNVWQGFRHERIDAEIRNYEYEQKEWFEENKRMLAALSVYSSPARVTGIAEKSDEIERQKPGQAIILRFDAENSGEGNE